MGPASAEGTLSTVLYNTVTGQVSASPVFGVADTEWLVSMFLTKEKL